MSSSAELAQFIPPAVRGSPLSPVPADPSRPGETGAEATTSRSDPAAGAGEPPVVVVMAEAVAEREIHVRCASCALVLAVPVGTTIVRCPTCGAEFAAPAGGGEPAAAGSVAVAATAAPAAEAPVEAPVERAESCFVCGIVLLIAGGVAGSMFLVELGVLGLCCAVPIFLTALLPWCCHGCSPSCCHDSCPATERQRNQHAVACMVGIVLLLIAGTVAYEVH